MTTDINWSFHRSCRHEALHLLITCVFWALTTTPLSPWYAVSSTGVFGEVSDRFRFPGAAHNVPPFLAVGNVHRDAPRYIKGIRINGAPWTRWEGTPMDTANCMIVIICELAVRSALPTSDCWPIRPRRFFSAALCTAMRGIHHAPYAVWATQQFLWCFLKQS